MPSLVLYHRQKPVFQDNGAWLHPLLALEAWLDSHNFPREELSLYDKVIGRAGALLIIRLGIRSVRTDLMSRLAEVAFEKFGVQFETTVMTDRILCKTEELLESVLDPERAHLLILDRIAGQKAEKHLDPIAVIRDLNVIVEGRHVLASVDLRIEFGQRVLVAGQNGAGKTTLLRAILGLLPAASGHIYVLGHEVGSPGWRRRRHEIGYVRQNQGPVAMPITVSEVVEIGTIVSGKKSEVRATVSDALHSVGAFHLRSRRIQSLSGGEQQRVSIARALAQKPRLLLLDEPTAGLDIHSRESLIELVTKLSGQKGPTVLVVSHDIRKDTVPDWRTLILSDGQLTVAT